MGKSYWVENQQGNFSNNQNDTFDEKKRYIGLRLQQGVPLLDRDWNELEDIRRYEEQMLRKHYIGNGTPDDGFRISACEPPDNDFKIGAGRCLVDGFEVVNEPRTGYICYTDQKPEEVLAPPKDGERVDTVYLDAWIEEVRSQGKDDPLNNPQDLNEETTVRHRLVWRVRVDEGSKGEYKKSENHHYYDIARIKRVEGEKKILDENIKDLREARGKDKTTIQSLTFKNDKVPANAWPKLTCEAANQLDVSGDLIIKASGKVVIGTTNSVPNTNFDRLLQMSPTGASKPGLNLLASNNADSNQQWWAWGVDTDNTWKIQPKRTCFSELANGFFIDQDGNFGSRRISIYSQDIDSMGGAGVSFSDSYIKVENEEVLCFRKTISTTYEGGKPKSTVISREINTGIDWTFNGSQKNFLINHPLYPETHELVHSTLEGPEVAVFYRGEAQLSNGKVIVYLPNYFEALTRKENRTVLLTPKFEDDIKVSMLAASEVKDGKFTVKTIDSNNPSQKFYWEVKAVRADVEKLEVEREKL